MDVIELTKEQAHEGMYTGDKEKDLAMANALIMGNVRFKEESTQSEPVPEVPAESVEQPQLEEKTEEVPDITPLIDPYKEEIEREKKHRELVEQKAREEREQLLLDLRLRQEEQDRLARENEELKKKLQTPTEPQSRQPSTLDSSADEGQEDDEYLADYTKQWKKKVDELDEKVSKDLPELASMKEEFEAIKKHIEEEKRKKDEAEKKRQEAEIRNKVLNNIRDFQKSIPELQTSKDIDEVEKEFASFREKFQYIAKPKSRDELDSMIQDYFAGGEYKTIADNFGIKAPEDYQTYQKIVEIHDLKNGIKYDPVLKKHVPILNDENQQVTYRSYEEAYRIKHYEEELTKAKRQASIEIAKKLDDARNSARTLNHTQTSAVSTGLTFEQKSEILNWRPKDYLGNPEREKLVERTYKELGLDPPQIRR